MRAPVRSAFARYRTSRLFKPVRPWPAPKQEDCVFYHDIDLPNGETIIGAWDIRGRFDEYVGNQPLAGKTVLDVGTASGFLAFSAEQAGAEVTATDAREASDFQQVQFRDTTYHRDRATWLREYDDYLVKLKNSFWYAWHRLNSRVQVVYAPIDAFPFWKRRFDVVLAGAILEHLADPVSAIGNMALLANEAVIVGFTPVEDTSEQILKTANDWSNPEWAYTWWTLSRGLYERVFENLGFSVEVVTASAINRVGEQLVPAERPTIVARRRSTTPHRAQHLLQDRAEPGPHGDAERARVDDRD